MPLYLFTICLLLISVATGFARFSDRPSDDSMMLSALFIGSTAGVVICLLGIASGQLDQLERSMSERQNVRRDA